MNDEKWQELIAKIKSEFNCEDIKTELMADVPQGKTEEVVFRGPLGRMKIVRKTMPRVKDKKTIYSKRAGAGMNVQYEYDTEEIVHRLEIYKWNEIREEWERATFDL